MSNAVKTCKCGCDKTVTNTLYRKGHRNGYGASNPNYKGGTIRMGYKYVPVKPDHPVAKHANGPNSGGKQSFEAPEHRLVMYEVTKNLFPGSREFAVHHRDKHRLNNSPSNLILFMHGARDHKIHHINMERRGMTEVESLSTFDPHSGFTKDLDLFSDVMWEVLLGNNNTEIN